MTTGRPRCVKVVFVTLCVEVVRSLGFEFRFGFGFGFGFLRLGIRLLLAWVKVGSLSIWFKAVGLGGSKNQGTRPWPKALEKPGRGPGRGTKGYSVACGRGKAVGAFMKTKHTLSPRYTIRLYTPPTLFRGGQNMGHKRRQFESAQLTRPPVTLRKLTTPVCRLGPARPRVRRSVLFSVAFAPL